MWEADVDDFDVVREHREAFKRFRANRSSGWLRTDFDPLHGWPGGTICIALHALLHLPMPLDLLSSVGGLVTGGGWGCWPHLPVRLTGHQLDVLHGAGLARADAEPRPQQVGQDIPR